MKAYRRIRLALSLSAALFVSGCAEKKEPVKEVKPQAAPAKAVEPSRDKELASIRDSIAARERDAEKLRDTIQDLDIRLRETERRLGKTETQLNQLRAQFRDQRAVTAATAIKLKAEPAPTAAVQNASTGGISVFSPPDPRLTDFITPPDAQNNDYFPFRITSLRGSKAVIGRHKSTRLVETVERVRDPVGNLVPRWREEEVDIEEHTFTVTFDVANLTKSDKALYASAGQVPLRVDIPAGHTVTGLMLQSSLGAQLMIENGGIVRRFDIDYASGNP